MALTPQDTHAHIIGSGALSYSWWYIKESHHGEGLHAPDDWYVVVLEDDPDDGDDGEPGGDPIRFDHKALSKAVNTLARTGADHRPLYMTLGVLRECRELIKDPQNADLDADMADQVLQYVAFGKVVYR